jgi:hypothetical protein
MPMNKFTSLWFAQILLKSKVGVLTFMAFILLFFAAISCNKQTTPDNPFTDFNPNQDTVRFIYEQPDSFSIAGIFSYVFKPTCSNVGCHDGTFEPDFRTLESAYNSLINKTSIKDDGRFGYRVHPGDPGKSGIMARLNGQLLPYMPIQLEPDSDWELNKDRYIEMIRTWISRGAPAVDGSIPGNTYPQIRLEGAMAYREDTLLLARLPLGGPILLDSLTDSVRIYFAFSHDAENPINFTVNTISFSDSAHDFTMHQGMERSLNRLLTPKISRGMYGQWASYTHYVDVSTKSLFVSAEAIWFRVKVKDSRNPTSELPGQHALFNLKRYMSFERRD